MPAAQSLTFCTIAEFLNYYDVRRVVQAISDTGTPVTEASITSNQYLMDLLSSATGMIAAAARVGQRYPLYDPAGTPDLSKRSLYSLALGDDAVSHELDDLTSGLGPNPSTFHIRKLTADIAFGLLMQRRGLSIEEMSVQAPGWSVAMQQLELLRLGERIFDLPGAADAGLPSVARIGKAKDSLGITIASKTRLWGNMGPGFGY